MEVKVTGHHISIGSALQEYVEDALNKSVKKYFDQAIFADVVFTKEAHLLCADIHVNEGVKSGILLKSDATAEEIHAAFDAALAKMEKQLRRYKKRLTDHNRRQRAENKIITATKYVIASNEREEEEEAPVIVAEKEAPIETLTVGEAVMKMDLASLPALMFINSAHGRINVVYRRADGNISWVDPQQQQQKAG